jgi:hypothetical protein
MYCLSIPPIISRIARLVFPFPLTPSIAQSVHRCDAIETSFTYKNIRPSVALLRQCLIFLVAFSKRPNGSWLILPRAYPGLLQTTIYDISQSTSMVLNPLPMRVYLPYESDVGGVFKLELFLPEEYPMVAPKIRFLTKIYHPNIDKLGRICMDTLKGIPLMSS